MPDISRLPGTKEFDFFIASQAFATVNYNRQVPVHVGSERLASDPMLRGRRIGVVCNPASINGRFEHVADVIARRPDTTLAALFGPQHGFDADLQENMIETPHEAGDGDRIPVYSLYSDTREPTAEMLQSIDLLVIDLQDIGTRIYTYLYTMANCLRAARKHGVAVIVCDRPNPIGGLTVEGPVLKRGFESFVGQFPIPMRSAMTIGELATLFNEEYGIGAELHVFGMSGWARGMYFGDTGLPWVAPSPNVPSPETAMVFPGAVLFEGTNVSEGRGTTQPFELIGAPWINGRALAAGLNARGLSGVHARPTSFQPTFHKHAGRPCGGCQLHVTDRDTFRPVLTGVALLMLCRAANPERFAWREPPYEYEYTRPPIDVLSGSDEVRQLVETGTSLDEISKSWNAEVVEFEQIRRKYLLY